MLMYREMDSPVGTLRLVADRGGLRRIRLAPEDPPQPSWRHGGATLAAAVRQLDEYFERRRTAFELPLATGGTSFQQAVWRLLREIPYGHTLSYGELARRLGRPGAARAVGAANRANPLPIVVPCHRVIGGDGSLTGYAGGVHVKRELLRLEGVAAS